MTGELAGELVARHAGQADVEQHDIGVAGDRAFHCRLRIVRGFDRETVQRQQRADRIGGIDVVVDDEKPRLPLGRGRLIAHRGGSTCRRVSERQP